MNDDLEKSEQDEIPEFIKITDVLDLHGTDPKIVKALVQDFLDNAVELKLSQVRIIHGKGKSVFKSMVYSLLQKHPAVMEYDDAPPELGHWGATIVQLFVE